MIILIWRNKSDDVFSAERFTDPELNDAMVKAERLSRLGAVEAAVYAGAICKVRWGPEDPGGIFNSGGTPTYDKGERENNGMESRSAELHGKGGSNQKIPA